MLITHVPRWFLYMLFTNGCSTGSEHCKEWIWCWGLTQVKHTLALGENLSPAAFLLNPFCKYYCNVGTDWGN